MIYNCKITLTFLSEKHEKESNIYAKSKGEAESAFIMSLLRDLEFVIKATKMQYTIATLDKAIKEDGILQVRQLSNAEVMELQGAPRFSFMEGAK